MAERQKTWITNWAKGLVNRRVPRLAQPMESLRSGLNLDLSDGRLVTRGGTDPVSSGLPVGTIRKLKHVRFPRTNAAYFLAQVDASNWWTYSGTGPLQRYAPAAIWDPIAERVIFFAGRETAVYQNDVWQLCPGAGIWTELSPKGTLPSIRYGLGHCIYDSLRHRMLVSNVTTDDGLPWDLWELDLYSLTWNELTPSGSIPTGDSIVDQPLMIYREADDTVILIKPDIQDHHTVYVLNCSTNAWSTGTTSGDSLPDSSSWSGFTGCIYNDKLYFGGGWLFTGYCSQWFQVNLDTFAVTEKTGTSGVSSNNLRLTGTVHDDEFWSIEWSGAYGQASSWLVYNFSSNAWRLEEFEGDPPQLDEPVPIISGDDKLMIVRGGLSVFLGADEGSHLYASNTHLPSTNIVFERIANLGTDVGTCSIDVLGDRAIIAASGMDQLVFSGGLSSDGSDWAFPLHVLMSEDGVHSYDFDALVLDNDPDLAADIGSLGSGAYLDVCCDVPEIEAFYLEFGTFNSTSADEITSGTRQLIMTEEGDIDRHDLRSGQIEYWKQYSGATGNFEGAELDFDDAAVVDHGGGQVEIPYTAHSLVDGQTVRIYDTTNYDGTYPLDTGTTGQNYLLITHAYVAETLSDSHCRVHPTIGSGNDCPYIEVGDQITIGSSDYWLKTITDDGEADGEIELKTAATSATCSYIANLEVANDLVTITTETSSSGNVFSVTTGVQANLYRMSIRQKLTATGSTAAIRVQFGYLPLTYQTRVFANGAWGVWETVTEWLPTTIDAASIVPLDSGANGTENPTRLTFNGGQYSAVFDENHSNVTSDSIGFAVSNGLDYLVCYDVAVGNRKVLTSTGAREYKFADPWTDATRGGTFNCQSGSGFYQRIREAFYGIPWADPYTHYFFRKYSQEKTVTVTGNPSTGFQFIPGWCVGVKQILADSLDPLPTLAGVGKTSQFRRILVYGLDAIESVTVTHTTPSGCHIYHAISLDDLATFQVYVSSAWRDIVRLNGSTWEYNDSATATPNWVSATDNSAAGALQDAFAISYNQMDTTALEALTDTEWGASGGYIADTTEYVDVAFALLPSASAYPTLEGYTLSYQDSGGTFISVYTQGEWQPGYGWEDNTVVGVVPFAKNGSLEYKGCEPLLADHYSNGGIPGFWHRIHLLGTSANTSITRITYKAKCQKLQSIGTGETSQVLAFIIENTSTGAIRDYVVEVSDETEPTGTEIDITADHAIYVGGLSQFTEMIITPLEANNTNSVYMTAYFWNGATWIDLPIVDGTAKSGATCGQKGSVISALPSEWRKCVPVSGAERGYYLKLTFSGAWTADSGIAEVKLRTVPDPLVKHDHAVAFSNRLALVGRPDAPDQADISGEFREYDWTSQQAGAYRIGGPDRPQAALSAWGTIVVTKPHAVYYLSSDFTWRGHETPYTPVNSQVVVNAPIETGDGARSALAYLGYDGAYAFSGLHIDQLVDAAKPTELSRDVNWWHEGEYPRLDLNNLWRAAGAVWGDLIVWAVPMLLTSEDSQQITNNRLIIFDARLGIWYPPADIALASLAQAYSYSADAPGNLGVPLLYGGDYEGNIVRLLDGSTDDGAAITYQATSGLISCGDPGLGKLLLYMRVYGIASTAPTLKIYVNGSSTADVTESLTMLVSSLPVAIDFRGKNLSFRYLEIEITGSGIIAIDVIELQWQPDHRLEGQ